ncbi:MAG: Transcriptional regulator, DeoR family [Actinomycetia bacterium]|nr:Transcriptional regulator, DeoR family [Actinomycetes bacterium]
MLDTSARLLRLLSLLQTRPDWSGPELAERLEVTTRTIRNDVERLRSLGYPVNATPGVAGGYRLGAGTALPPLLLDDDEAVAVAIGLRTAANGTVVGLEETSVRALAKLEQVLPSRLRHRVGALQAYMVPMPGSGPTVDAEVLTLIAGACRDYQRLRFDYRDHGGTASVRDVEPHRLVCSSRRWYLLAWDTVRQDWRIFRVDRMEPRTPTGPRFGPRDLPDDDVAGYVAQRVSSAGRWGYQATVTLHASAEAIAALGGRPPGRLEPVDEHTCLLHTAADSLHMLAVLIAMLDVDFTVTEPPELLCHLRTLAGRYGRAAPTGPGTAE